MGRLLLLSLLAGCNDKGQVDDDDSTDFGDGESPDIDCTPLTVDFGELSVLDSEIAGQIFTCFNTGLGDLQIEDLTLSDDVQGAYSISTISSTLIMPDSSAQFSVTYTPTVDATDAASIIIESNDPDEPSTEIALLGDGIAPALEISVDEQDFGTVSIGCAVEQDIEIRNAGREVLTVDALSLTSLGDFTISAEALPWSLGPDEAVTVTVEYSPIAEGSADINLAVESNDPSTPQALVALRGVASASDEQTDTFSEAILPTDVLIAVDASGSLGDEQYGIWTNFDAFVTTLAGRTDDYRIALLVQDSGKSNGTDYIDSSNAGDAIEVAAEMLSVTAGNYTEMGFTILSAGLESNDWLRDNSRLNLIGISDEPEQSSNSYSYYVSEFQALRDSPDDVMVHAIGGDYPSGCGVAQAYTGMYEATVATGGIFLSLCTKDWADTLTDLADAILVGEEGLSLSAWPVVETISVTVSGSVISGWVYDAEDNAILLPSGGAEATDIAISYLIQGECN